MFVSCIVANVDDLAERGGAERGGARHVRRVIHKVPPLLVPERRDAK